MIRLTINAPSDPEIHLFNKSAILIGADSSLVDLVLNGEEINPIHLKISEQNGFLVLLNQANDPFASVNGHPFGKKLLNSGDVILAGSYEILFEKLDQTPSHSIEIPKKEPSSDLIEKKMMGQEEPANKLPIQIEQEEKSQNSALPINLPFEKEVEILEEAEWKSQLELYFDPKNSSIHSVDQSTPPPLKKIIKPNSKELIENKESERKKTASLKDDYLRDLDDDNQLKKEESLHSEPSHLVQAWKWIIIFIASILTITGLVGTVIYFSVSDKTEAQETKAAQAMADIAMALTHAKLNHLRPHNQNWSDIEFLKNNLQTLLPDSSTYASQLDFQGQFHCCPYSLRIYTNSDLSHFLLIAQPAPSLLQWLIPKAIIVVDSKAMELRTLKDVRSLNRLLANPDPLEGVSGKEISALVKQGVLIGLSSLASDSKQSDFAPPKNLEWIQPGAENLVYNAPRYFRLGQNLLQRAANLSTSKGTSQEVAALKQDVENFSTLNHFILYDENGKKSALLMKQGLMTFAPSDKLLFGYLSFNNQGKIYQVHLLKDDDDQKEFPIPHPEQEEDQIALMTKETDDQPIHLKFPSKEQVDFNHPIYIQLQALTMARENELGPLGAALIELLNQEMHNPKASFHADFQTLSHAYLMADAKHKQGIKETLEVLYFQYEDMPINQFFSFIKQLRLDLLIHEDHAFSLGDENCIQNLETMLIHIEKAKSLTELDNFIHIATTWLSLDYMKDPQELMKYQNLLRNKTLAQLENQLLSESRHLHVKADDREVLERILNHERLIKPEEKEFFLIEFEELLIVETSNEKKSTPLENENENEINET